MTSVNKGSCLCGVVKFEVVGELESFFLCHCKYCQKDTGSAHAANIFTSKATLTWLNGEDKVKTFNLPNTRHVKNFCSNCSSALPVKVSDSNMIVIPAGSLDTNVSIVPSAHIFTASRAGWDKDLEQVCEFESFPK
ncbi:GFA family protein [Bacteriovorax sp. Seq25_V]|uniref:GFA family protein n=1 Tax=Bacteriovorax sp. Seq25_V TaxID=1201288 RepID=UPI00038A07BD|nr:GFA family protein [Bacteriovorax sp. Seq25_V]EQC47143.1 S-(hydroxymethyl)glutathione synthase [Bacteriovorax sp. Seq25_V]